MKKLLCLALSIIFVCFALVSCAEDVIGEYLPNYNNNKVTDDKIEKLNFYIITGEGTSSDAKITVPQNINTYLKEKYEIELNINYYTAKEYNDALYAALDRTNEAERPDVILINSKDMFDTLYANDRLIALNDLYNSRDYRSINTIIDDVLLAASAVTDPTTGTSTYYTVPNNHVIGEYKYVVIDKTMARDIQHFSVAEIEAMTTEESLADLKSAIADYFDANPGITELEKDAYVDSFVKVVSGDYKDKLLLEYGVENESDITASSVKKNFVNINSYPNATKDEAFLSAFAIVKELNDDGDHTEEEQAILSKHYNKCMKIIFALNNDAQLKNMLQYGYVGTNYKFIKNEKNENTNYIQLIKGSEVYYEMNPIHTGNLFISYYCEEIGWNEKIYTDILRQNADSKTPMQKLNTEFELLDIDLSQATAETVLDLPSFGSLYSDVLISWSTESEFASVDQSGVLSFVAPEQDTEIILTATFVCSETSYKLTKDFKIKLIVVTE